jgi:pseudaminic acid synthase
MSSLMIGGRMVGGGAAPFFIAEMSGNHNQSLDRALAIVDAAAAAGADAIKLQSYTPEMMTLDLARDEFVITNRDSPWYGRALFDLYREAATPFAWHAAIFARARERGILCFSAPFGAAAVELLEDLAAPCYKIASFELVDLALIRRVAATGKPLILSTGMATVAEIDEAVVTARQAGAREIVVLKCTSTYPAPPEASHLLTIPHLQQLTGCAVGLSDHTLGIGVAIAAIALGAVVIEKHFTLSRADGGVDSLFSLEPGEFQQLVSEGRRAHAALGQIHYGATAGEVRGRSRRRSLYVVRDVVAGEVISEENVRAIRPGLGLMPRHLPEVIGRIFRCNVACGTPLSWLQIA